MNWWLFALAMILFAPVICVLVALVAVVLSEAWEKNHERFLVNLGFAAFIAGCVVMGFAVGA